MAGTVPDTGDPNTVPAFKVLRAEGQRSDKQVIVEEWGNVRKSSF